MVVERKYPDKLVPMIKFHCPCSILSVKMPPDRRVFASPINYLVVPSETSPTRTTYGMGVLHKRIEERGSMIQWSQGMPSSMVEIIHVDTHHTQWLRISHSNFSTFYLALNNSTCSFWCKTWFWGVAKMVVCHGSSDLRVHCSRNYANPCDHTEVWSTPLTLGG